MVAERTRWWIVVVGMLIVALWENVELRHLALENSRLSKESAALTQQLKEERAAGDDFTRLIGPFDPTEAPDGPYFEDIFYDNTGRGHYLADGRGCQGVSDDTAAFQAAIDYATGKQPKLPIITCYVIFDGKPYRLQSFTDTGGKP